MRGPKQLRLCSECVRRLQARDVRKGRGWTALFRVVIYDAQVRDVLCQSCSGRLQWRWQLRIAYTSRCPGSDRCSVSWQSASLGHVFRRLLHEPAGQSQRRAMKEPICAGDTRCASRLQSYCCRVRVWMFCATDILSTDN